MLKSLLDDKRLDPQRMLLAAQGDEPAAEIVHVLGKNPDIDTSAEDVHDAGGTYPFPTAASVHAIVSDSAEDNDQANAASGSVEVVDYTKATAVKASGEITYGAPVGADKATNTVTIVDYTKAVAAKAIGSITYGVPVDTDTVTVGVTQLTKVPTGAKATGSITYGAPVDTDTVIVNGNTFTKVPVGAKATEDITYGAPNNGDSVEVAGHWFMKVASDPGANQFSSADNLASAINALSEVDAVNVAGVITVTAASNGTAGNAITMSIDGDNTGTLSVGAATLSGGVDDPGANEFSSIAELEALVEAVALITSVVDGGDIDITADANGVAGNAITLALGGGNTGTMTVSGATLTGGLDDPGATEFDSITRLTSLINALADVNATDNGTVISIEANTAGTAGNSIALEVGVGNTGTMSVSGATLTGGQDSLVITVNGSALTESAEFTAATGNNETATSLAAAIEALAGYSAVAVGEVVTITKDTRGTAGNADTLTTSTVGAATVGGATFSGGVDGDTVVVAGTTFTCVVGTPGAAEFATIAQLTALIEALATVNATDDATTITVEAATAGTAGNSITLALGANAGTMAVSGATLTNGRDTTTVTVGGVALVQGTDWTAETDNDTTAENLADAINTGVVTVTAVAAAGVITITAITAGAAGNSIGLVTSEATAVTVSGATLTGGDDANSTGARTLRVTGLSSAYAEITEDVTLAGTVSVNTTKSYLRINSMEVLTVGSNGAAVGNITATAAVDGTVTAKILAGNNQAFNGVFTVPDGKTAFIVSMYSATPTASMTATTQLLVRVLNGVFVEHHTIAVNDSLPVLRDTFATGIAVAEKADIKLRASTSGNNANVIAGAEILLVAELVV